MPGYGPLDPHEYSHGPAETQRKLMFNSGDPVEFDGDLTGGTISALRTSGPPRRMSLEDIEAGESPYRALEAGQVTVRQGATGIVVGVGQAYCMVRVAPFETTIAKDALRPAERRHIERTASSQGGYVFAFDKRNLVPLKLENERRWGKVDAGVRVRAS